MNAVSFSNAERDRQTDRRRTDGTQTPDREINGAVPDSNREIPRRKRHIMMSLVSEMVGVPVGIKAAEAIGPKNGRRQIIRKI